MKGSYGSNTINQMCHSQKLRKWVKILAPAGSLDAICVMTQGDKYFHKGRRTWRSLMPNYSPTEESAARDAMQDERALKATVCGSQGLGQGVGQALGMKRLGCFFTRNRNPADNGDWLTCKAKSSLGGYDWSSNGENDGAVTVDSCKAAARPGWSTHTGLTYNKAEMWVTPQNHEDLTCRNGDYKRACTWYGLAV